MTHFAPLGLLVHVWALTQGVALGYHLVGLRPEIALCVRLCSAPTGHHVKAWGNAPGKWRGKEKAPTGRNEFAKSCRPVGASDHLWVLTQGVALGYHLAGLWPGIALRAVSAESHCDSFCVRPQRGIM